MMKSIWRWLSFLIFFFNTGVKMAKCERCRYMKATNDMYCKGISTRSIQNGVYPVNITSIRKLDLSSASLTSIEYNSLHSLQNLTYLNMNDNSLTTLDYRLFSKSQELLRLYLARNKLSTLDNRIFSSLANLIHLDISANGITTVDSTLFASQRYLLLLKLDGNQLNYVPTEALQSLVLARNVDLQDNPITCNCTIIRDINSWTKGKCFNMRFNCWMPKKGRRKEVDSFLNEICARGKTKKKTGQYPNQFIPSARGDSELERRFQYERRWQDRDPYRRNGYESRYNSDRRRNDDWYPTYRRPGWSSYDRDNDFDDDDDGRYYGRPGGWWIIHRPIFEENYDDYIDETYNLTKPNIPAKDVCPERTCYFSRFVSLMDCEGLKLGSLEAGKYPFVERGFKELILDNSGLNQLKPNAFQELPKLTSLSLKKNNLQSISPKVFEPLKDLLFLDLSENNLGNILNGNLFEYQADLRVLYMTNNQIYTMHEELLEPLVALRRLFLSNNPLLCDCKLQASAKFVKRHKIWSEGSCQSPPLFVGRSWAILTTQHARFCSIAATHIDTPKDSTTVTLGLFGGLCLLGALLYGLYKGIDKCIPKPKPGDPTRFYYNPEIDYLFSPPPKKPRKPKVPEEFRKYHKQQIECGNWPMDPLKYPEFKITLPPDVEKSTIAGSQKLINIISTTDDNMNNVPPGEKIVNSESNIKDI